MPGTQRKMIRAVRTNTQAYKKIADLKRLRAEQEENNEENLVNEAVLRHLAEMEKRMTLRTEAEEDRHVDITDIDTGMVSSDTVESTRRVAARRRGTKRAPAKLLTKKGPTKFEKRRGKLRDAAREQNRAVATEKPQRSRVKPKKLTNNFSKDQVTKFEWKKHRNYYEELGDKVWVEVLKHNGWWVGYDSLNNAVFYATSLKRQAVEGITKFSGYSALGKQFEMDGQSAKPLMERAQAAVDALEEEEKKKSEIPRKTLASVIPPSPSSDASQIGEGEDEEDERLSKRLAKDKPDKSEDSMDEKEKVEKEEMDNEDSSRNAASSESATPTVDEDSALPRTITTVAPSASTVIEKDGGNDDDGDDSMDVDDSKNKNKDTSVTRRTATSAPSPPGGALDMGSEFTIPGPTEPKKVVAASVAASSPTGPEGAPIPETVTPCSVAAGTSPSEAPVPTSVSACSAANATSDSDNAPRRTITFAQRLYHVELATWGEKDASVEAEYCLSLKERVENLEMSYANQTYKKSPLLSRLNWLELQCGLVLPSSEDEPEEDRRSHEAAKRCGAWL